MTAGAPGTLISFVTVAAAPRALRATWTWEVKTVLLERALERSRVWGESELELGREL